MAFSIVAQVLQSDHDCCRVGGQKGTVLAGRQDQGGVDHTPYPRLASLQSSFSGWTSLRLPAAKFANSSISRLWRTIISASSPVLVHTIFQIATAALERRRMLFTLRYVAQANPLIDFDAEAGVIDLNCQSFLTSVFVEPVTFQAFQNSR